MEVAVLNGWAASEEAWGLCKFERAKIFSYLEQLDGAADEFVRQSDGVVLVGWSMGSSMALRIIADFPEKVKGLVLIAATPRMMEDKEAGWVGMSPRRFEAFKMAVLELGGQPFMPLAEGLPNPYQGDSEENLLRGLDYLQKTDLRDRMKEVPRNVPIYIFQASCDGIVRSANVEYLAAQFEQAKVKIIESHEHALQLIIPKEIDEAVDTCVRLATQS